MSRLSLKFKSGDWIFPFKEKRIEELLEEEGNASASGSCNTNASGSTTSAGQVNWQARCDHLRLLNSHLEAERAKLAQIRLQLELKLQEATGNYPSMKPTSLWNFWFPVRFSSAFDSTCFLICVYLSRFLSSPCCCFYCNSNW